MEIKEINQILSDTLIQLANREISPKRARSISHIANVLTNIINYQEIEERLTFLEQTLKNNKHEEDEHKII